jgi:ubiquinone/menaquinone biosynthesis C-methylase UbiE
MRPRLQRRVQRYGWDKASSLYERYWARPLQPAQVRLTELARLAPGERVLDVACGTGLVTFPAAVTVGSNGHVLGTDLSSCMIDVVSCEAQRRGMLQVEARRMDAEDLMLPDASFDAVLCALGLMYVPNPETAMAEMNRVLRVGGRVAAAVWGRHEHCGWADIFPIMDARVASEVCPLFFELGAGDALQEAMGRAGFEELTVERFHTHLRYATDDEALQAAFAAGPVALAYSRFDDATRESAHAEYLESIRDFKNGSGYRIPGEFVLVSGRKPLGD